MENSALRIVKADGEEQIALCAQLANVIWHECYAHILKPEQIDYMVDNMQSAAAITRQVAGEGYEYYILYDGEAPAGYIAIQPKDGMLLLSKLYVEAARRGRGLGEAALAFVEETGRRRGCAGVWLTVNRHNRRAISVYRKTGYHVAREQQVDIGGGFVMDDFVFEKPL